MLDYPKLGEDLTQTKNNKKFWEKPVNKESLNSEKSFGVWVRLSKNDWCTESEVKERIDVPVELLRSLFIKSLESIINNSINKFWRWIKY